jgi:predicted Ser/Thr protein kinase
MSQSLVGSNLGKYQITAEIGKGGMGLVYQGYDPLLDRQVAIKVLAPHLIWEPGFVERFLREARAAARLKHTGIVTIYDVGQEGERYYIVMEYLDGRTLGQIIRQEGPLAAEKVIGVLRQLAGALDYAHQQRLVHRDVKPGNVVVNSQGHATLTDFGVARAAQETRLTTTGALIGTPQYMSPEQAQGYDVDHRTDIYSLAVVAYEMLTGRAPFGATTPHAVLHQLIYEPPPPARSLRPDLPAEADRVLGRALDKEPARRYESAGAFVQTLQGALAPAPARAKPGPRPPAARSRAPADRGQQTGRVGLWWFLASALGWAAGWALAIAVIETIFRGFGFFPDPFVLEMVAGAIFWAVQGLVIGLAQWLVLRRHLPGMGWWLPATVLGFAVVGSLKWGQGMVLEETMMAIGEMGEAGPWIWTGLSIIPEGLTGLLIGLAQWPVLQNRLSKAGRWVLVNVLAWIVVAIVFGLLGIALGEIDEETGRWFPILSGLLVAAITAWGMARLLSRRARTD